MFSQQSEVTGRMNLSAFGAYFNADIGLGRTNLYLVATRTPDAGIRIIRMNAVFHGIFNPLKLIVSKCLPLPRRVEKIFQGFSVYPETRNTKSCFIYSEKKNMSITIFTKASLFELERICKIF